MTLKQCEISTKQIAPANFIWIESKRYALKILYMFQIEN